MFQRFKDTRVSVDTTRLTQREETVSHESLVHTKPMRVISREKKKKNSMALFVLGEKIYGGQHASGLVSGA